jgi:hypothetical protein
MKTKLKQLNTKILAAITAGLCFCANSWADPQYSIPWYKIAGGGGTCSGGGCTLSGTIGQHDASSQMTGGNVALTGGFWAFQASPGTGVPTLYIAHTGNSVSVYWQNISGWSLQQNANLANPSGWVPSTGVTPANGTNYLNLPSTSGNMFFRLTK